MEIALAHPLKNPSPPSRTNTNSIEPNLLALGYWTEAETAKFLNKSVSTLRSLASRRKGPPRIKNGKAVIYKMASVTAWLDAREVAPEEARRAGNA